MSRFRSHGFAALFALLACATLAHAGPSAVETTAPPPSKHRTYTLTECLRLADRNHPSLWAARAKLAGYHAQLDEAHTAPFWQFHADANLSSIPNLTGSGPYSPEKSGSLNTSFSDGFNPWIRMGVSGGIPLYTFGKIEWIGRAAEGQVRLGQWEVEAARQQTRMDVRKAYYGATVARDVRGAFRELLAELDKVLDSVKAKLDQGTPGVDEADRMRLEIYHDQIVARSSDPDKSETAAMAALRFYTGVQSDFDIPNEPLKRPEVAVAPVVSYLIAARLFRPDVNRARSGLAARRAQLEFVRANLYPNMGVGAGAGWSYAPSAVTQNGWVSNPYNGGGASFGILLGVRWTLDILPGQARVDAAAAQVEEVRALNRLALGGVAIEVENAYGTVLEARNREQRYDHAERITKQWLTKVEGEVERGSKDVKDVMDPLRAYFDIRTSHLTALMDYSIALSDLARVTGWDTAAPQ
ncbi:MAG TPA: TolC family protein [Polyangiaceae bacterium]|nr:TolC family protein [Polyangiaceae bacterium]